jgi:hypothetical protein
MRTSNILIAIDPNLTLPANGNTSAEKDSAPKERENSPPKSAFKPVARNLTRDTTSPIQPLLVHQTNTAASHQDASLIPTIKLEAGSNNTAALAAAAMTLSSMSTSLATTISASNSAQTQIGSPNPATTAPTREELLTQLQEEKAAKMRLFRELKLLEAERESLRSSLLQFRFLVKDLTEEKEELLNKLQMSLQQQSALKEQFSFQQRVLETHKQAVSALAQMNTALKNSLTPNIHEQLQVLSLIQKALDYTSALDSKIKQILAPTHRLANHSHHTSQSVAEGFYPPPGSISSQNMPISRNPHNHLSSTHPIQHHTHEQVSISRTNNGTLQSQTVERTQQQAVLIPQSDIANGFFYQPIATNTNSNSSAAPPYYGYRTSQTVTVTTLSLLRDSNGNQQGSNHQSATIEELEPNPNKRQRRGG